jgi:hypothetical protein
MRFQRTGSVNGADQPLEYRFLHTYSLIDLKEGKESWISWTLDDYLGQNQPILDPQLVLKISLPKEAIKCLERIE